MGTKMLAGEYIIAIGVVSWAAIKKNLAPWPPAIIYTSAAFAILGILSNVSPELAGVLGAGFLLAALIRVLTLGDKYAGGFPLDKIKAGFSYVPIHFGDIPSK